MAETHAAPEIAHTSRTVEQSLAGLRLDAVAMGGLAIDQVASAVDALLRRDEMRADLVLSREALINTYERRIERDSLTYIALQQPVAVDLRLVHGLARIAYELERVGDEAKKIARFALNLARNGEGEPVVAVARYLRHMAELSVAMLRSAVRAADESDAAMARQVLERDRELDAEFATALRQLMFFVMQDSRFMQASIDTVFALKGLERIGDHATNVAEQVLYFVEGRSDPA